MRTTIDLDPELHADALAEAHRTGRPLSAIVNDALRRALHPPASARPDQTPESTPTT